MNAQVWFIFLVSCIAIALAAFLVIYIGHKVIQKIERDDKMSDVEQEIYEQVKKKMKEEFQEGNE